MNNIVLLDAGPLGLVRHPRASTDAVAWLAGLVAGGAQVLVPEIADDDVRRELLRANRLKGIRRLDQLKTSLGYLPITTAAMLGCNHENYNHPASRPGTSAAVAAARSGAADCPS